MACGTIHTPEEAAWPSFRKLYDCVWCVEEWVQQYRYIQSFCETRNRTTNKLILTLPVCNLLSSTNTIYCKCMCAFEAYGMV
jgi:hypothetical protein